MLIAKKIPKTEIVIKEKKILELTKGKKVLHLGAIGSDLQNYRNSLHFNLQNSSLFIRGVDINKAGIKKLQENGVHDIIYGDIEMLGSVKELKKFEWDYIIAADVLEHVSNPGKALKSIKSLMSNNTDLIITLPNAFGFRIIFTYLFLKKELVDPTHTFWPSYTTFTNLLKRHELIVKSFNFALYAEPQEFKSKLVFKFLKRFPLFSSCLFFIVKKGNKGKDL